MLRPPRIVRAIGFFFAVIISFSPIDGQRATAVNPVPVPWAEAIAAFEQFTAEAMRLDGTTGLSIAFMKDDFVWAKGFGYADLENMVPAKPESSYRLASITKTITAFAVLQLAEAGKVDLDAEVQAYVPYFPKKKWPVTVRQLLGHLGGISHYRNDVVEGHIKDPKNTKQAIAIFQDFDLVAEPGTRYSYSTYGFILLGAVVEGASGESYGDVIRKRVFEPLGMADSKMDNPRHLIPNRVRGYQLVNGVLKNSEYVDVSSRFAGGGTRSTVLDLIKFAQGIIAGKLVKAETQKAMFTSMAQRDGRVTGYGMGWMVDPWKGHFQVGHSGSQPETQTFLALFPAERFAVAAASNFEGCRPVLYVRRLIELVFDEDLESAAYAGSREGRLMYSACDGTFSTGLSQYVRDGKELAQDDKDLESAFAYFKANVNARTLQKNFTPTKKNIIAGFHLGAGQALTKVGSHMAAILKEAFGADTLFGYTKSGPVAFFNDYIRATKKRAGWKKAFFFDKDFITLLAAWEKDWQRTYPDAVRRLAITPASDFEAIARDLKTTFSGASFYRDFSEDFAAAAQYFLDQKASERAVHILDLSRDLYPNSPAPYASLASVYAWMGKFEESRKLYEKAFFLDNTSEALGVDRFLIAIGRFRRAAKIPEGLAFALLALDFYPKDARLHLEAGNFYAAAGERDKAAASYRKALELDPGLEAARINLERLK